MTMKTEVLDHGFVELLDVMGDDAAIEAAARVSFTGGGEEERTEEQTRGLIRYLLRNRHTTPFEMVEFKFRVCCPIFVWRQWIRHRTANVNEISGRYTTLPDLNYVPALERMQKQSQSNKQGSAPELVDGADSVRKDIENAQVALRADYERYTEHGLAKELARVNVPVAQYTVAVWKIDLHNLFHFLSLRMDPHAQYEIRVYADAMAKMVAQHCPIAWEAFEDYRLGGMFLTAQDVEALRHIINDAYNGEEIGYDGGVFKTAREASEFSAKLGRLTETP